MILFTGMALPASSQTVTDTSTFLSVDLAPLENSPDSNVRYKSFLTSPGNITSGKPIFLATDTLPKTRAGFSSFT